VLGRMLFSDILHLIRTQFKMNPIAAADRLQPLTCFLESGLAAAAWEGELQLESQLLLKELRIGQLAPTYSGFKSDPHARTMGLLLQTKGLLQTCYRRFESVNVVEVDLSKYTTLLEVPEDLRRFKEHMRQLKVASEAISTFPGWLGEILNLQKIYLVHCYRLKTLPESIGNLSVLHTLDLHYCTGLKEIPESIGRLQQLHKMDLSSCGVEKLPKSIGCLTRLRDLNLSYCSCLNELPESMLYLTGLKRLNLSYCKGLNSLPEHLGGLTGLQHLNIIG
jgi:hypothetical protein